MTWRPGANFDKLEVGKLYEATASDCCVYPVYQKGESLTVGRSIRLKLGEVLLMLEFLQRETDWGPWDNVAWPVFLYGDRRCYGMAGMVGTPNKFFRRVS